MIKKMKSRQGMTLSELLVVLVIMSLVGSAIAVGISATAKAYDSVTSSSEAAVLCGTIATELSEELRYAKIIEVDIDDSTITYSSARFGKPVKITSDNGFVYVGNNLILGKKVYSNDLKASVFVTYSDGNFHVSIEVAKDTAVLANVDFYVRALNPFNKP